MRPVLFLVVALLCCGTVFGDTMFSFGNFGDDSSPIFYFHDIFHLWLPYSNTSEGHHHFRFFDSWTEDYYWAADSAGTLYDAWDFLPVDSMPSDLTGQVFTVVDGFMLGNFASPSHPEFRGIASFSFHAHSGSITPFGEGLPEGVFVHDQSYLNATKIIAASGTNTAVWARPNTATAWQPIPEFTAGENITNRAYVIFHHYDLDEMYVGGSFTTASGFRDLVMMDEMTGAVTPVFSGNDGLNPGGSIRCICKFFDDKTTLYVAGDFTSIGGVAATGIAKFSTDTMKFSVVKEGAWENEDGKPIVVNTCYTMSGQILFGGSFTKAAATVSKNVFILQEGGSIRPLGLNSVPGEVYSFNTMARYPGSFGPIIDLVVVLFVVGTFGLVVCCCCCVCFIVVISIVGVVFFLRRSKHSNATMTHEYFPVGSRAN